MSPPLKQQDMSFFKMSEQLVEDIKKEEVSPKNIYNYIRSHKHSYEVKPVKIPIHQQHNPRPAYLNVGCCDQSFFAVILHYQEEVGTGSITGYSLITKKIDAEEANQRFAYPLRTKKPKPTHIGVLLPSGYTIAFTKTL